MEHFEGFVNLSMISKRCTLDTKNIKVLTFEKLSCLIELLNYWIDHMKAE